MILSFDGDLNATDCESTSKVFQEIIDSGVYYVVALMSGVSFISSPFLGELMGCKLRLVEKEGNLVVVGLPITQREKLILMGADRIFQFYPDIHSAYNHFQWDFANESQTLTVTLPPDLHTVPALRRFVSGAARQKGYSSRDAFRIETLIDEVANNAIEHGDPGQNSITVAIKLNRRQLEIEVRNRTRLDKVGQLKEIIQANKELLHGNSARGRGLALVKMISQSLNVTLDGEGTCVSVTKLREDA
jgi:anti-sigma regulatory factor (Ser/Thr protein kinase)/anti-anti-sigma regulatory factor